MAELTPQDQTTPDELPEHDSPAARPSRRLPEWWNPAAALFVVVAFSVAYVVFVAEGARDVIVTDAFDPVQFIAPAVHGHLSLGSLFALHNENRMLVPNVVFLVSGVLDHYNQVHLIVLGALLLVATNGLLVLLCSRFLQRSALLLEACLVSAIMLSPVDVGNAFHAFQMAWYLVLLIMVVTLWLLGNKTHPWLNLGLAVFASALASFSSLQGLLLWPVGLFVIAIWRPSERYALAGRKPAEGVAVALSIWASCAVATTLIYFGGLPSNVGKVSGSSSLALRDPWLSFRFMVQLLGAFVTSVAPFEQQALGLVLAAAGIAVVVSSARAARREGRFPLDGAVTLFALLFGVLVTAGRVKLGIQYASETRYSMVPLLLATGIVLWCLRLMRTRPSTATRRTISPRLLTLLTCAAVAAFSAVTIPSARQARNYYSLVVADGVWVEFHPSYLKTSRTDSLMKAIIYPDLTTYRTLAAAAAGAELGQYSPHVRAGIEAEPPPIGFVRN
ncbi:MAG TPA: hypothetical protein VGS21_11335 [Acidimicrobiales bacterium]|nr:hypothetical protein [Acidimicrobiales bacterium]